MLNRPLFHYGNLPLQEKPSAPPRQPLAGPPQAPGETNPPRCLGRIRQPVFRQDNVYRNRSPVDIFSDNYDDPFIGPRGNQSPGPSGSGNAFGNRHNPNNGPSTSADPAQMAQDGGAELINFLLRAAVSSVDAKGKIPDVSRV